MWVRCVKPLRKNWKNSSYYTWNIEKIIAVINDLKDKASFAHILGRLEIALGWIQSLPDHGVADYNVVGTGGMILANLKEVLEHALSIVLITSHITV